MWTKSYAGVGGRGGGVRPRKSVSVDHGRLLCRVDVVDRVDRGRGRSWT